MTEQDFSKRIVIVVRKDIESWQVGNTIAHISAYFGHKLGNSFGTDEFFRSKDGFNFPRNSQYPIIIKAAENDEQLRSLLSELSGGETSFHAFIREMIETTSDSEIESILTTKNKNDIELLGIGVFGEHEPMKALTKKFDLWK